MRLKRLRRAGWAAWLGIVALAVNLLVPVHLAFDLAEAVGHSHHGPSHHHHRHGIEWRVLALASGHFESGDGAGQHGHAGHHHRADHHNPCQVCSSTGTLAAFAPASAAASLPLPAIDTAAPVVVAAIEAPRPASAAGYRSRAPPLS